MQTRTFINIRCRLHVEERKSSVQPERRRPAASRFRSLSVFLTASFPLHATQERLHRMPPRPPPTQALWEVSWNATLAPVPVLTSPPRCGLSSPPLLYAGEPPRSIEPSSPRPPLIPPRLRTLSRSPNPFERRLTPSDRAFSRASSRPPPSPKPPSAFLPAPLPPSSRAPVARPLDARSADPLLVPSLIRPTPLTWGLVP